MRNLTTQQADAHALPFSDESFDRVTCRFGVMYFADEGQVLREIRRVLRPGGRVAFIAWGLFDQNPLMQCALVPFLKRVAVPPPPPGAPHPFKYAQSGTLATALQATGFNHVHEVTRTVAGPWPGPPDDLWHHFYDIAAPFRPLIESLAPEQREQAIIEVIAGFQEYYDGQQVNTPLSIVIASGVR